MSRKKKMQEPHESFSHSILGGIVGIGLIAAISCYNPNSPNQKHVSANLPTESMPLTSQEKASEESLSFEHVRKNSELRKTYLEQLRKTFTIPSYIRGITYYDSEKERNSDRKQLHNSDCLFETQIIGELSMGVVRGLESRIIASPRSFEHLYTEDEFRDGLLYHEFRHAQTIQEGFDFIQDKEFYVLVKGKPSLYATLYNSVQELDALKFQMEQSIKHPGIYTIRYLQKMLSSWDDAYRTLWQIHSHYIDSKIITMLKVRFFHDMMGNPNFNRIVQDFPGSETKYTIVPRTLGKRTYESDAEWNRKCMMRPLPQELNSRIDRWWDQYQANNGSYQTPEFSAFTDSLIELPDVYVKPF